MIYLLLSLSALSPLISALCTQSSLEAATALYLKAQIAGQSNTLSSTITYTENFKTTPLSSSILSQPLTFAHNLSIYDTTTCATYTELIVTTPFHPYVIGSLMHVDPADSTTITTLSTLVTDAGDWLFNATGTLYWASRETWTPVPASQRNTRATIQAAADAYLDLFNNKSVIVPWDTPCARLEGGSYTGSGGPNDSCNVGVPTGVALVNRKYVIDESLGSVDVFLNFGGESGVPDSHEFRVEKGKLRYVHTLTVTGQ